LIGKLTVILVLTSLYTFVRYVIFGDVSPDQMPVYLLNKSIAMASTFFLFLTAISYARTQMLKVSFWGMLTLHSAYIHIILSLALWSKAYYPRFFNIDKMNLTGELMILLGILAAYTFWHIYGARSNVIQRKILQLLSTFFVAGHLVVMGFNGWLSVEKWYGGLPPISLISFLFVCICLVLFLKTKNKLSSSSVSHFK